MPEQNNAGAGYNPTLAGIGGSIGGSLVGGAMTMLGNYIQQKYYERNMQQQYNYNERAAKNADRRARALFYDLYAPGAQKQMYVDAGFSPSIMYSQGMQGVSGSTPHGAQGAGANMQMPGMAPLHLDSQFALTAAQIELMKSEARKNNADADTQEGKTPMGQATIQNILSSVGLNDSITALNRIDREIKEDTKEFQVQLVEENLHLIQNQAMHEYWKACDAELQFEFDEANYDTNCKILNETFLNLQADSALKEAQKRLTNVNIDKVNKEIEFMNQEIAESIARVQQGWKQLALTARGQTLDWRLGLRMQQNMRDMQEKELKYVKQKIEQTEDLTEKGFWFSMAESVFHAVGTISAALIVGNRIQGNPGRTVVGGFK